MARRPSGLPRRQRLIGLWLLLSGISIFGGATFALWLDTLFQPQGLARLVLWAGCFSGGGTIFLVGLLLERQLFTPLRHLQVQLARLVANPDARDDYPPEGWLRALGPDLVRVREAWRSDRSRLATAHAEGPAAPRVSARSSRRCCRCSTHRCCCATTIVASCFSTRPPRRCSRTTPAWDWASDSRPCCRPQACRTPCASCPPMAPRARCWSPAASAGCGLVLRRVPGSHGETLLTLTGHHRRLDQRDGCPGRAARRPATPAPPRCQPDPAPPMPSPPCPRGPGRCAAGWSRVIHEESQGLAEDIRGPRLAGRGACSRRASA